MKYNNNNTINRCKIQCGLKKTEFQVTFRRVGAVISLLEGTIIFPREMYPNNDTEHVTIFKTFILSTEFHLCTSSYLYCGFILMKNRVDVQWLTLFRVWG